MNSYQGKRIYRSEKDKVIGGVFGGIAEYFDIDPVVVRLLGVLSIFFSGVGLIFYFLAWMIIPENPHQKAELEHNEASREAVKAENKRAIPFAFGVILVILGALMVADELHLVNHWHIGFNIFPWRLFWPLVLIFFGVYLLVSRSSVQDKAEDMKQWAKKNRLSKSSTDRKLFGVCGGLARQWDMDPTILRLLFAVGIFVSFGFGVLLYLVLAVILPTDRFEPVEAEPAEPGNGTSGS